MTGSEFRAVRERLKLSRPKMADLLGINRDTLFKIEAADEVATRYVNMLIGACVRNGFGDWL